MAAEAARDVEHVGARLHPGEAGRGQRVRLGLRVTLLVGVRAQVEVAEERVPGLGRARIHAQRMLTRSERASDSSPVVTATR